MYYVIYCYVAYHITHHKLWEAIGSKVLRTTLCQHLRQQLRSQRRGHAAHGGMELLICYGYIYTI